MCSNDNLKIDFQALTEGESEVSVRLTDEFFESVEGDEIPQGDMHVTVSIRKTTHFSEVHISATGVVQIPCDRCLDLMEQPVEFEQLLTVKMGNERSDDDDLVILSEREPVLDLTWYIYETIVLNLPVKHVHAPGKCNPAMINMLNEHSATRSDDTEDVKPVDSRWSKLSELKF